MWRFTIRATLDVPGWLGPDIKWVLLLAVISKEVRAAVANLEHLRACR